MRELCFSCRLEIKIICLLSKSFEILIVLSVFECGRGYVCAESSNDNYYFGLSRLDNTANFYYYDIPADLASQPGFPMKIFCEDPVGSLYNFNSVSSCKSSRMCIQSLHILFPGTRYIWFFIYSVISTLNISTRALARSMQDLTQIFITALTVWARNISGINHFHSNFAW